MLFRSSGDADAGALASWCHAKLAEHRAYVMAHGTDMPEVADWRWRA